MRQFDRRELAAFEGFFFVPDRLAKTNRAGTADKQQAMCLAKHIDQFFRQKGLTFLRCFAGTGMAAAFACGAALGENSGFAEFGGKFFGFFQISRAVVNADIMVVHVGARAVVTVILFDLCDGLIDAKDADAIAAIERGGFAHQREIAVEIVLFVVEQQ